jgi:hypothetical protein
MQQSMLASKSKTFKNPAFSTQEKMHYRQKIKETTKLTAKIREKPTKLS